MARAGPQAWRPQTERDPLAALKTICPLACTMLDNSFPASVTRRVYLGAITNFHVTLDQTLSLVLTTSDQRLARRLDRDSQVRVGWNAGDERVVRD